MSIRLLSDQTINKIAAGEVIENPASIVKELVENALDAKGDFITIEIERGGFSLIRISDNGMGMGQEDLLLCLERHATSKIRAAEDLHSVLTMGFRGEALASIGAVSRTKISSADGTKDHGYEISSNGGKLSFPCPIARSRGTTVEVSSLFYNVPARLKFQKSAQASQNAIKRLISKLSLAYPNKRFRYFVDKKEVMDLLPEALKERCCQVLGDYFIKEGFQINFSEKEISLEGWVGAPPHAKSNRMGQFLFINGRGVISPQISSAIYEAYGTRLQANLHPSYVLQVTLPAEWVDINVHPQKKEVRLRKEKDIQRWVRQVILGGLQGEKEKILFPKIEWEFDPSFRLQEKMDRPAESLPILDFQKEEDLPIIGQFDAYLIVGQTALINLPNDGGIYLVDLRGATARILYERFLNKETLPFQTLLFPLTFEFSPHEKENLLLHIEEVRAMGIDLRAFGETTFIVDGLSPDIEEENVQKLLESLAQVFDQNLIQSEKEKKLALSASYSARSQKKGWALVEAKQTVKALLKTTSPYHCPKGMKTIIALSHDAIKKLFQKKSC